MTDRFLDLAEHNIRRLNAERDNRDSEAWRANNRLWKIMMLCPHINTAEAMLKGDPVPIERLDPEWVDRFGLRGEDA